MAITWRVTLFVAPGESDVVFDGLMLDEADDLLDKIRQNGGHAMLEAETESPDECLKDV